LGGDVGLLLVLQSTFSSAFSSFSVFRLGVVVVFAIFVRLRAVFSVLVVYDYYYDLWYAVALTNKIRKERMTTTSGNNMKQNPPTKTRLFWARVCLSSAKAGWRVCKSSPHAPPRLLKKERHREFPRRTSRSFAMSRHHHLISTSSSSSSISFVLSSSFPLSLAQHSFLQKQ
jgi:hypothetical protein